MLYNKEGSIPDEKFNKYYKKEITSISKNSSSVTFYYLPKGNYAVFILHDENKNSKIDKKFILPTEGVGLSNFKNINLTNRPNFSKASFQINEDLTKTIKIIYKKWIQSISICSFFRLNLDWISIFLNPSPIVWGLVKRG